MKFKKNFISILENFPVHCDSAEQVRDLKLKSEIQGIYVGLTENIPSDSLYYGIYEGQLLSGRCDFFTSRGYGKPLEFDELLEPEEGQENDNVNYDNLVIKVNDIINDLIDYANKKCESTIHTAEAYRDGYIKGCKDSLGEVRAIISELNNN